MPHTPGPWTASLTCREYVGPFARAHISTRGNFICGIYGGRSTEPVGPDEADANARLIAAAPDLLAALEYIVARNGTDWSPETARDLATKAIAKAKGE